MPDVVVLRIPEEDIPGGKLANATFPTPPPPPPPPPPHTLLVRLRWLLFLPFRKIRAFLLRLWHRFFGPRLKP
jgi:hypothetical protein